MINQELENIPTDSYKYHNYHCFEFGKRTVFNFPFKEISSGCAVSAIASATAAAFAAGASSAPSAFCGGLVLVCVTGPSTSVGVCLRHDDISFVLYGSMR